MTQNVEAERLCFDLRLRLLLARALVSSAVNCGKWLDLPQENVQVCGSSRVCKAASGISGLQWSRFIRDQVLLGLLQSAVYLLFLVLVGALSHCLPPLFKTILFFSDSQCHFTSLIQQTLNLSKAMKFRTLCILQAGDEAPYGHQRYLQVKSKPALLFRSFSLGWTSRLWPLLPHSLLLDSGRSTVTSAT